MAMSEHDDVSEGAGAGVDEAFDDPIDAPIDEGDGDGSDESLLDRMRHTGVGVEDPNIVGDPEPGIVDDQVASDEEPEV